MIYIASSITATNASDTFGIHNGKLYFPSSARKELQANLQTLKIVSDKNIPSGYGGGLLFDGTVIKALPRDQHGQPAWFVKVDHVYSNDLFEKPCNNVLTTIKLISPTKDNLGVNLVVKRRYRIFAIDLGKAFNQKSTGLNIWLGGVLAL